MISIVIPVKDGGDDLIRCLDAIRSQRIDERVEIVVVDSGSSDGSTAVARARGAVVHEIPAHEFSHGASRNLGARCARGEFLVFISQDAYPVDSGWLVRLVGPLRSEAELAGVYGRQLAHDGATPPESYFLNYLYGPTERRQRVSGADQLAMDTTLFSNVNSAIPKPVWEQFSFVEDIIMSEDQEWSRRVLLAGLSIAYQPDAAVRHSHNYTLAAAFRRFFDSGASSSRAYMAGEQHSSRVLRAVALDYARGELAWLWRTRQRRWIPYAALYEFTKMLGLIAGVNHARLPLQAKRRLSALPSYWG
ncbi:MAG: glycosyltransferase [Solirubrobacteraceae bacterium]